MLWQISGDQQEAARGAELLILGTLLQHYCAEEDENRYTDALEVNMTARSFVFVAHIMNRHASMVPHVCC